MSTVSFKKGLLANLPATHTAGTFYVTTDERAMYLDVDASTRIRLGDFQEFATVDALKANANPNTSALYYAFSRMLNDALNKMGMTSANNVLLVSELFSFVLQKNAVSSRNGYFERYSPNNSRI